MDFLGLIGVQVGSYEMQLDFDLESIGFDWISMWILSDPIGFLFGSYGFLLRIYGILQASHT